MLAEGFEIRLELRRVLIQLGEARRVLEQVREAETLAEKLNDDNRRGRVCAFMTNALGQLGELDEPLTWGGRALAIADTLGSAELRIPDDDLSRDGALLPGRLRAGDRTRNRKPCLPSLPTALTQISEPRHPHRCLIATASS